MEDHGKLNLFYLTEQESGILVWDSGKVIVANWGNCEDNQIPTLSPIGMLMPWTYDDITVEGYHRVDDIRKELPGKVVETDEVDKNGVKMIAAEDMDIVYDPYGDIPALFGYVTTHEAVVFDYPTSGTVYSLTVDGDHLKVIAPVGWN